MSALHIRLPLLPLVLGVVLTIAGCASNSIQTAASGFVAEHAGGAAQAATATSALELAIARLPGAPSRTQLAQLARDAARAQRNVTHSAHWSIEAGRHENSEENGEEEDLPRAESQVTGGARELAAAISSLHAYVSAPTDTALSSYKAKFARGQEQWNEGISQVWYLAHRSNPPIV